MTNKRWHYLKCWHKRTRDSACLSQYWNINSSSSKVWKLVWSTCITTHTEFEVHEHKVGCKGEHIHQVQTPTQTDLWLRDESDCAVNYAIKTGPLDCFSCLAGLDFHYIRSSTNNIGNTFFTLKIILNVNMCTVFRDAT